MHKVKEHDCIKTRVTWPHQGVELIVLVADHLEQGGGCLLLKHGCELEYVGKEDGQGGDGVGGQRGVLHQLQEKLVIRYQGRLVIT